MRDDAIFNMNQRRIQNEARLQRQFSYLLFRIDAYEAILSRTWNIVKAIFRPSWLKKEVDALQMALMQQHDEEMKQVAQKAKEEAKKPKLTIVNGNGIKPLAVILCVLALSTGCVPKSRYRNDIKESYDIGYRAADKECMELQGRIGAYIESLKDRLSRFNQIDGDGNLRPLRKWTGDTDSGEVTGKEGWMK